MFKDLPNSLFCTPWRCPCTRLHLHCTKRSDLPMTCTTSPCSSPRIMLCFPRAAPKCQPGSCTAMSRGTVPRCGRGAGTAGDTWGQSSYRSSAGTAWTPHRAHSESYLVTISQRLNTRTPRGVNARKITICGYFSGSVSGQWLQILIVSPKSSELFLSWH